MLLDRSADEQQIPPDELGQSQGVGVPETGREVGGTLLPICAEGVGEV